MDSKNFEEIKNETDIYYEEVGVTNITQEPHTDHVSQDQSFGNSKVIPIDLSEPSDSEEEDVNIQETRPPNLKPPIVMLQNLTPNYNCYKFHAKPTFRYENTFVLNYTINTTFNDFQKHELSRLFPGYKFRYKEPSKFSGHPLLRNIRRIQEHEMYLAAKQDHPTALVIEVAGDLARAEDLHRDTYIIQCKQSSMRSCKCELLQHINNPCFKCALPVPKVYMFTDSIYEVKLEYIRTLLSKDDVFGVYFLKHRFNGPAGNYYGEAFWCRTGQSLDMVTISVIGEPVPFYGSCCDWAYSHEFYGYSIRQIQVNGTMDLFKIHQGHIRKQIPSPTITEFLSNPRAFSNMLLLQPLNIKQNYLDWRKWSIGLHVLGDFLKIQWTGFNNDTVQIVPMDLVLFASQKLSGMPKNDKTYSSVVSQLKYMVNHSPKYTMDYNDHVKLLVTGEMLEAVAAIGMIINLRNTPQMLQQVLGAFQSEMDLYNRVIAWDFSMSRWQTCLMLMAFMWYGILFVANITWQSTKNLQYRLTAYFGDKYRWRHKNMLLPIIVKGQCLHDYKIIDLAKGNTIDEPDTICCNEFSHYSKLYVYGSCFYNHISYANACQHNAHYGMMYRNLRNFEPMSDEAFEVAQKFSRLFIERFLEKFMGKLTPYSYERWNSKYDPVKRKQHDDALDFLKSTGADGKRFAKVLAFVKLEPIIGKKDPDNLSLDADFAPRIIMGTDDRFNVLLGPYITAVKDNMVKMFDGQNGITFACGWNKNQLGEWFTSLVSVYPDIVFNDSDQSKFDGHIQEKQLRIEQDFIVSNFVKAEHKKIKNLLEAEMSNSGHLSTHDDKLKCHVENKRRTGDQNTTTGNTWISLIFTLICLGFNYIGASPNIIDVPRAFMACVTALGKQIFLLIMGDDCIIGTVGWVFDLDKYVADMAYFGFDVKIKTRTQCDIQFCSNVFIPCEIDGRLTHIATQLLGRNLVKAYVSIHKYTQIQSAQWLYHQSDAYMRDFRHIPFMYEFHKAHHVKPPLLARTLFSERFETVREDYVKHVASVGRCTPDTYAWFEKRYGFSMVLLEKINWQADDWNMNNPLIQQIILKDCYDASIFRSTEEINQYLGFKNIALPTVKMSDILRYPINVNLELIDELPIENPTVLIDHYNHDEQKYNTFFDFNHDKVQLWYNQNIERVMYEFEQLDGNFNYNFRRVQQYEITPYIYIKNSTIRVNGHHDFEIQPHRFGRSSFKQLRPFTSYDFKCVTLHPDDITVGPDLMFYWKKYPPRDGTLIYLNGINVKYDRVYSDAIYEKYWYEILSQHLPPFNIAEHLSNEFDYSDLFGLFIYLHKRLNL